MSDEADLTYEVDVETHEPKPVDGIELRDALAGDYRRGYWRNQGVLLPRADAEALAAEDCRITDRYDSERKSGYATTQVPDQPDYKEAKEAAEKAGGEVVKRAPTAQPKMADPGTVLARDKMHALQRRIGLLCGTSNNQEHYPRWAALIREEYLNLDWGRREYRFLVSDRQRARVYARRLEDIADQSNSDPGLPNWWVK